MAKTETDSAKSIAVPRDAATLILVRSDRGTEELLMGRRGTAAAFMPQRRVFPGGALDPADCNVPLTEQLADACMQRLARHTERPELALPLALTAIRETFEETGLAIGQPNAAKPHDEVPAGSWSNFFARGLVPTPSRLRFMLRAITPAHFPIRFDARFFVADATAVAGDLDDLSGASGELHDLRWIAVQEVAELDDLPFITRVAVAEIQQSTASVSSDHPVPFYAEGRNTPAVEML